MDIRKKFDIYFELVNDSRKQANVIYRLSDILFMLLTGMLCGQKDIESILELAEERMDFFLEYTEMKQIPCIKTVMDILGMVKLLELELCMYGIFRNVFKLDVHFSSKQVCIDGKTICTTASMEEYNSPLHIVTAFLADDGVCLAQKAVENKSNEITAVRDLIEMMDIKDRVITADALNCQKETAELIIDNKGDYVLQVKANQKRFYEDIFAMFDEKFMDENDKEENYEIFEVIEKGHGRIEKRICYVLKETSYFTDYKVAWKGLQKIFAVKREIEKSGKKSSEISCYISSKDASAQELLSYTRKHWQIESFHWLLDMDLGEDRCTIRNKNIQSVLNILRKNALSMIKQYIANNNVKRTAISANMRKCAFNVDYLIKVLSYYSVDCNINVI